MGATFFSHTTFIRKNTCYPLRIIEPPPRKKLEYALLHSIYIYLRIFLSWRFPYIFEGFLYAWPCLASDVGVHATVWWDAVQINSWWGIDGLELCFRVWVYRHHHHHHHHCFYHYYFWSWSVLLFIFLFYLLYLDNHRINGTDRNYSCNILMKIF